MARYYITKREVYEVSQDRKGFIHLTPETENAGWLISCQGGVKAFLEKCIDDPRSLEEVSSDRLLLRKIRTRNRILNQQESLPTLMRQRAMERERALDRQSCYEVAYAALIEKGVIEVNVENLRILLHHLNGMNWGEWKLPSLSQGYTANQHDCGGKRATTIRIDKGIEVDGKLYREFQCGAPSRYLVRYQNIDRL